jgi:hypothetical protein
MGPEAESATPVPALPVSGDPSGSPFLGPGALTRVAPFAVVAAVAEASLALPPGPQSAPAAIVSVLLLLAVPAAFLLPWPRLPTWATVFVPLLYTGSVLALILAAGATSGVGIVLLVPLAWTALFHRRWESACVVAAIVAVEVIISLTPVAVAGPVIARRVLLWSALGALISVATHGLRDRIGRAQADRERLQDRLRELSVMEDRDRIAAELRDNVIQRIFAAGLSLQGAADLAAEPECAAGSGHRSSSLTTWSGCSGMPSSALSIGSDGMGCGRRYWGCAASCRPCRRSASAAKPTRPCPPRLRTGCSNCCAKPSS